MKEIGITTTVPIEVLLAAGYKPVDLNNLFISDPDPERLVNIAERDGFPINCCTWIKGIYGIAMEQGIDTVLCVTTGDCSNTIMLMEVWRLKGLNVIPFAYPDHPYVSDTQRTIESLADTLGTTVQAAEEVRKKLEPARNLAAELDRLTWRDGVISGWENHYWLVSSSDFLGDFGEYERQLSIVLHEAQGRNPYPDDMLRLAYIGVPAVFAKDMYHFVETQGARVVYNEIQRQFAMTDGGNSLAEQYSSYTYPYSIFDRLNDIIPQLSLRRVDGVIHYVQAFCHRGIGDIIFRQRIDLPILTLEGNNEYLMTQHVQTRVEAFLDMIKRRSSSMGDGNSRFSRVSASKTIQSHP
jgi:benzoyl-CoA reductase/2-hydroxyglutaryl-CoA dehydratase subunit BcrC/BadD/HgdB